MEENWWGWLAVIVIFLVVKGWRVLFNAATKPGGGMAQLNAAAERILKERSGAAAANPPARGQGRMPQAKGAKPMQAKSAQPKSMQARAAEAKTRSAASSKPRSPALLPKSSTPAVIRRGSILSSREPVIQRRR